MKTPSNFDELITQTQNSKLYQQLVNQLKKDFLLANIDLELPQKTTPILLKKEIENTIFNLLSNDFNAYLNLLYIVDVNEKQIKAIHYTNTAELSFEVTFLIIKREWQKVWYKAFYKH